MLDALLRDLFLLGIPREAITVVTRGASPSVVRHGVSRLPEAALVRVVGSCPRGSLFIHCGGSVLLDNVRACLFYGALGRLASTRGSRTVLYAVGVEPARTPLGRVASRARFAGADAVLARDECSFDWFCRTLRRPIRIALGTDPIVGRTVDAVSRLSVVPRQGAAMVLVSPLAGRYQRVPVSLDVSIGVVRELSARFRSIDIVALGRGEGDLDFARTVEQAVRDRGVSASIRTVDACDWTLGQAVAYFRERELVISMRYHGLLLAALCSTPAIAVFRSEKVRQLALYFGLPLVSLAEVGEVLRRGQLVQPRSAASEAALQTYQSVNRPFLGEAARWFTGA